MYSSSAASPRWGDVIVELPLQLYRIYGDRSVLEQNYDAMKRWQRCLQHMAESELSPEAAQMEGRELENQRYLINTGFQFGDWLVPSVKNEQGFRGRAGILLPDRTQGGDDDLRRYDRKNSEKSRAFSEMTRKRIAAKNWPGESGRPSRRPISRRMEHWREISRASTFWH